MAPEKYPILVLCGSDARRRKLLRELDPEGKYPTKALLPFLGRRVIDWQLDALRGCSQVGDLLLLGLTEEQAAFPYPVRYVPVDPAASLLEKLVVGMEFFQEHYPGQDRLIVSTCDTPGMRAESVQEFFARLAELPEADVVISGVPEAALGEDFPDAGRVVGRFRDQPAFPGELFALRPEVVLQGSSLIDDLARIRRRFNRNNNRVSLGPLLRYLAGKPILWGLILRYLAGKLTIPQTEAMLSTALGMQIRGVIIEDPGFGMDLDRPEDYELLERYVLKIREEGKQEAGSANQRAR